MTDEDLLPTNKAGSMPWHISSSLGAQIRDNHDGENLNVST